MVYHVHARAAEGEFYLRKIRAKFLVGWSHSIYPTKYDSARRGEHIK